MAHAPRPEAQKKAKLTIGKEPQWRVMRIMRLQLLHCGHNDGEKATLWVCHMRPDNRAFCVRSVRMCCSASEEMDPSKTGGRSGGTAGWRWSHHSVSLSARNIPAARDRGNTCAGTRAWGLRLRGEGAEQISVGEEQGDLPQRKRHRATQRRGGCGGSFGARGARRMGARLRHLSCRVGRVASSQANRASLLAVQRKSFRCSNYTRMHSLCRGHLIPQMSGDSS